MGLLSCDKGRLQIEYAFGVGIEPLTAQGAELWRTKEQVGEAALNVVLLKAGDRLVLTATYDGFSFRSALRTEREAREVLKILHTLHGASIE